MRQLTKQQKKRIKAIFDKMSTKPYCVEDLPLDSSYSEIEELNPHETFYQNVNRYLDDLYREWQNNQPTRMG